MSDRPSGGDMTAAFSTALDSASAAPAADTSPVSTPAPESAPADVTPAAATAQPAATEQTPESVNTEAQDVAKGEPPAWRWQDILANARKTATEEAEARVRQEVQQQYAGVQEFAGMSAEERAGLAIWHKALNGDAQARATVAERAPQLAQGLGWSQAPAADPEPEPDFQSPDGTPFYSAPQQAKRDAWLRKQFMQDVQKELAPLKQDAQTRQQEHAATQYKGTLQSVVASIEAADPAFKQHKKDVLAVINADPDLTRLAIGDERTQPNPRLALQAAWNEVYRTKVVPAQQQKSEADVLANLQKQAVAGTVNPSSPNATTPKKFSRGEQGFTEALAHFGAVR